MYTHSLLSVFVYVIELYDTFQKNYDNFLLENRYKNKYIIKLGRVTIKFCR